MFYDTQNNSVSNISGKEDVQKAGKHYAKNPINIRHTIQNNNLVYSSLFNEQAIVLLHRIFFRFPLSPFSPNILGGEYKRITHCASLQGEKQKQVE